LPHKYYKKVSAGTRMNSTKGMAVSKEILKLSYGENRELAPYLKENPVGRGHIALIDEKSVDLFCRAISDITGELFRYSPPEDSNSVNKSIGVVQLLRKRGFTSFGPLVVEDMPAQLEKCIKCPKDDLEKQISQAAFRIGRGYRVHKDQEKALIQWQDRIIEKNGGPNKYMADKDIHQTNNDDDKEIIPDKRRLKDKKSMAMGIDYRQIAKRGHIEIKFVEHIIGRLSDYRISGTIKDPRYSEEVIREAVSLRNGAVGLQWERIRQEGITLDKKLDGGW
jgi:hypothetical protein